MCYGRRVLYAGNPRASDRMRRSWTRRSRGADAGGPSVATAVGDAAVVMYAGVFNTAMYPVPGINDCTLYIFYRRQPVRLTDTLRENAGLGLSQQGGAACVQRRVRCSFVAELRCPSCRHRLCRLPRRRIRPLIDFLHRLR